MEQSSQHALPRQPLQVQTRFAKACALEQNLAHAEAVPNQLVQRNASGDDVPAARPGVEDDPALPGERLDGLRFDQGHFASGAWMIGVGPYLVEVAISFEALAAHGTGRLDRRRRS